MTQTRTVTSPATRRLAGVIADGAFKVALGAAFIIGAARLGDLLGVPSWLMAVSGVALLIGGGIEIGYVRSRPMRTYTRLMVAYDSGWVLATLAGLLMAWRGSGAGGEVWIGYQTAVPIAFAALLVAATSVRPTSDTRAKDCAP
ncbi:hypothetical protein SAMN05216275_11384 [Streptosporangium canum]|uniref:Uncharacterized protein n=1 Tax=Streptosporangium canum TaxID=324952 RepID=A0A1I3US53_9ACTN|nr:hypothetical protein [Streptosporangium canum]SFJ86174.1 hypothetical protein SAMN05216275_11384 [Streptosporangium canum]